MTATPTTASLTRFVFCSTIMRRRATSFPPWDRSQRSVFIPPYFIDRYLCVLRYVVELINEYEGTEGHDDNLGISTLRCLLDAKTPVGSHDTYTSLPKDRNTILSELFTYNWLSAYVPMNGWTDGIEVQQQGHGDWRTAVDRGAGQLAGERRPAPGVPHLHGSCCGRCNKRWR